MVLQEIKDIYLFGIVGTLVAVDIVFLIPVTIPSARLRREYEEIEGDDVSIATSLVINCLMCYNMYIGCWFTSNNRSVYI